MQWFVFGLHHINCKHTFGSLFLNFLLHNVSDCFFSSIVNRGTENFYILIKKVETISTNNFEAI